MNANTMSPTISVVTATKNVASTITNLYESLTRQSFQNFEWIVIDGLSDDATPEMLQRFAAESPWMKFVSEGDFGIYDAINKAIVVAKGQYYVVAGADDRFDASALQNYADMLQGDPDVILARVIRSGKVIGGFYPRRAWIGHSKAFRGAHSVGMLFRRRLHDTFGMYSKRFPMLADGYFLKLLLNSEAVFLDADFVAGTFSDAGISSVSKLQTLVETWQIQMLTERFPLLQTSLFLGKIVLRYRAVVEELKRRGHSAKS